MNKMKKITLAFVFIMFCSVTIHAEDQNQQNQQSQQNQQFEGFNLAGYGEGGKKAWDVKGDTADIVGDLVNLTNVVGNAYGAEKMNVTADYGTVNKQSGLMHLQDDVVMTTDSGAKLTTDSLDWERDKDLVRTDDLVTLTRDGMVATGTGATGHPNLKEAQLNKDVTVNIEMKDDKAPNAPGRVVTITCDGAMEMEYLNSRATFQDNVVAIDGDRKLKADKMEVFFSTDSKQIKEMICTGNVSVVQGENATYSDKAVYKAAEKKLVLSGKPKLILYTDEKGGISLKGSDTVSPSAGEKENDPAVIEIPLQAPSGAPAAAVEPLQAPLAAPAETMEPSQGLRK